MAQYIEREPAEKIARKYGLANGSAIGRHTGLADCIADEIAQLPAAKVAPVRHSEWLSGCVCSWCGDAHGPRNTHQVKYYRYCPYCGAKMDGGCDNG